MTQVRSSVQPLLCVSLFIVFFTIFGCSEGNVDAADRSAEALATSQEELEEGNYLEAYDYLLYAMRASPESMDVFNAANSFVQKTADSEDVDGISLSYDVYSRMSGMIPFQSLDDIKVCREKLNDLAQKIDANIEVDEDTPARTLQEEIASTSSQIGVAPPVAVSLKVEALRQQHTEMAMMLLETTQDDAVWQRWKEQDQSIEKLELAILSSFFNAVDVKAKAWLERAENLKVRSAEEEFKQYEALFADIAEAIESGYELIAELQPYVKTQVPQSLEALNEISEEVTRLEQIREWLYNQHALAQVRFVSESKEISKIDKLKRLSTYDERRLIAFVLSEYQKEWKRWYDELDSDEDRVKATKMRILKGGD